MENKGIFKGKKFIIGQRVPDRSHLVSVIKENDGTIVKTEKWADIIIGTCEYGYAPPNSVSHRFIWDSLCEDQLQDIEQYRLRPNLDVANSSSNGIGCPVKKTKTPFTANDDMILLDWCSKAAKRKMKLSGLQNYKELAQKHDNHTAQSWRSRFLTLSRYDPLKSSYQNIGQKISQSHCQSNEIKKKASSHGSSSSSYVQEMDNFEDKAPKSEICKSNNYSSRNKKSAAINEYGFTEAETASIFESYAQIINTSADKMANAWVDWAKLCPGHTAKEWHDYFFEYVKPRCEKLLPKNCSHSSLTNSQNRTESTTKRNSCGNSGPLSLVDTAFTENIRGTSPFLSRSYMEPKRSRKLSDSSVSIKQTQLLHDDPMLSNEELFKHGLQDLAEELDLECIQLPEFGGYERVSSRNLWQELAKYIGFHINCNVAAQEIKDCYCEILAVFEKLRHDFLEETKVMESHQNTRNENQSLATTYHSDEGNNNRHQIADISRNNLIGNGISDDHSFSFDSVKQQMSRKKQIQNSAQSQDLSFSVKRQRIRRSKFKALEIPSTPDYIINGCQDIQDQRYSPDETDIFDRDGMIETLNHSHRSNIRNSHSRKPPPRHNTKSDHIYPSAPENDLEYDFAQRDNSNFPITDEKFQDKKFNRAPAKCRSFDDLSTVCEKNFQPNEVSNFIEKSHTLESENFKALITKEKKEDADNVTEDELSAFISENVAKSNITEDIVIEALEVTSMSIGPGSYIEKVIESLSINGVIPENLPGVWTKDDDKALNQSQDSSEYVRILKKHGNFIIQQRKDYWNSIKDLDSDDEDST